MKRTIVFAALTAAAVLLAGCSSTGGTATAASSTSAAVSGAVSGTAAASSGLASSTATSSAATESSAAAGTDDRSTGAAGSHDSTTSPTKTVGDTTGAIDAQTTVWFTAFCTGFAPVIDITSSMSSLGDMANPAAAQKKLVSLYTTLGSTFTNTAATLKGLPAPTFPGGATFASQTVTAFESAGPAFTSQAKQIAAANITRDPSSLGSAMTGLSDSMGRAVAPLEKLGTLKLTAQTQAALEKIPACAKIQALAGG